MEYGGGSEFLPAPIAAVYRPEMLGLGIVTRLLFFGAGITINLLWAVSNFSVDFWTHLDVWAPVINTGLLIYLYRTHRDIDRKTEEVKAVVRESTDELRHLHDSETPSS